MIEGSGSGSVGRSNGSGRPKNIQIQIRNTAKYSNIVQINLNYTVINLMALGMVSSTVKYFLFLAWTAGVYITAIYIFKRNKAQLSYLLFKFETIV
jgi:hypothetical protein